MADTILIQREGRVVTITLNRPEALNALNSGIMTALSDELSVLDRDMGVGCFLIRGAGRAFAAGADIKEMADKSYADVFLEDFFAGWDRFAALRTPKVAAVSGFALGGGCELAMMCDIIIAADNAKFGQPEIRLGVIPGMGGSQRLTKLVGKTKAMDLILTGRTMDAAEAERCGLVARVTELGQLDAEAHAVAAAIASYGKIAAMAAKEAVDRALETSLREGVLFERRLFHSLFATEDKTEGMSAFVEKRQPRFNHS